MEWLLTCSALIHDYFCTKFRAMINFSNTYLGHGRFVVRHVDNVWECTCMDSSQAIDGSSSQDDGYAYHGTRKDVPGAFCPVRVQFRVPCLQDWMHSAQFQQSSWLRCGSMSFCQLEWGGNPCATISKFCHRYRFKANALLQDNKNACI
jgi:hypothetical protein